MTIWDRIYQRYKRTGKTYASLETPLHPTFLDFLQKAQLPSKKVLDIGCGTGSYLKYLKGRGFDVDGIDSSETAVTMAREALSTDAKITLADMYSLELPRDSYGLVISISAMTHGKKQQVESLVGTIYKTLVPGGKLFLTLIATWNREETLGKVEFIGDGEFIPQEGPEKGLIHNSFTEKEIQALFLQFRQVDVQEDPTSGVARKFVVMAEK